MNRGMRIRSVSLVAAALCLVALGTQAWYVEVPHCGHAILPEQPEVITDLVVRFLRDHP